MPVDSFIEIKYVGFQPLRIPISDLSGKTYSIYLTPGSLSIVEYRKVYLNFKIEGNEMLVSYMGNSKVNRLAKQ